MMKKIKIQQQLDNVPLPCGRFGLVDIISAGRNPSSPPRADIGHLSAFKITALTSSRLGVSVVETTACYGTLLESVLLDVKRVDNTGNRFKMTKLEELIEKIVKDQTGDADAQVIDMNSKGTGYKTYVHVCRTPLEL
jgi:hypothetical protein